MNWKIQSSNTDGVTISQCEECSAVSRYQYAGMVKYRVAGHFEWVDEEHKALWIAGILRDSEEKTKIYIDNK